MLLDPSSSSKSTIVLVTFANKWFLKRSVSYTPPPLPLHDLRTNYRNIKKF